MAALLLSIAAATLVAAPPATGRDGPPPDAGRDASGDASPGGGDAGVEVVDLDALRARVARLARSRDAVRALLAGSLPDELYTTELFRVALLDEPAVERRRAEIEAEIASLRPKSARDRGDAGAHRQDGGRGPDGGDAGAAPSAEDLQREATLLELDLAEARLAFLQKPEGERRAVLAVEAEHRRLAEEKEAAAAAQRQAKEQEQAAEAARRRALDEAEAAREAGERALANERARVEGVRGAQAALRGELAQRRQALTTAERDHARASFELTDAARTTTASTGAADALYEQIVGQLGDARRDLRAALDAHAGQRQAPRYEADKGAPAEGRASLQEQERVLAAAAKELDATREKLAWDAIDQAEARVSSLNALRLAVLDRLTAEKRSEVLGVGAEGVRQFQREVGHVELVARWAWASRHRALAEGVAEISKPLTAGSALTRLSALIGLVFAGRFLARRGPAWLGASRGLVGRTVRRRILSRPLLVLLSALRNLLPEIVFLALVLAARLVWRSGAGSAFAVALVLHSVLRAYAIYRLAIAAAHRGIAHGASMKLATLSPERSDRILRSVRVAGRYALGISIFLIVSAALLGRGYLHHVALRFAWLGALPIAAMLVRSWRADICDGYLRHRPTGTLTAAVERTRERWYGFFVALAAFVFLLASFVARSTRGFVLRFEQSRKALAYLFRRRLERRAGEHAEGGEVAPLPPAVLARLTTGPVSEEPYVLDRFPDLARFDEALDRWENGARGAVLVVGKTGHGKTSWLNAAAARAGGAAVVRIHLRERIDRAADLVGALSGPLGAEGAFDAPSLVEALRAGPRRVAMVDDVQNLFQRGVGALEGWRAFNEVIAGAGDRVLWVAAIAHHPYEYLAWARRGVDSFQAVVSLPAWTEREIAELLTARTRDAGYEPVYEDLVVDDLSRGDAETELVSTGQEYMRLIWDYAEGSPRVAIHCWAASLAPAEGMKLRVKLFRRPREDALDQLTDAQKFVLASVIWHESITPAEAVRAVRYPRIACEDTLQKLHERGVLERDGERYRISVPWWPAVRRYLRRKHLIET